MSSIVTIPAVRPYSSIDDAELGPLALEVGEQIVQWLGLGHDRRLPDHRGKRRVRAAREQLPDELVDMHDPADLILVVVLGDEQARMAGRHAPPQPLADGCGDVDRDDRGNRRHHLSRLLLVQVEDARQHVRLTGVDLTARLRESDDPFELVRCAALGPGRGRCRAGAGSIRTRRSAGR